MLKRLAPLVQPLFLGLAFLFIGLLLYSQWDELRSYEWHFDGWWLAVSALFMLASWGMEIAVWRNLLGLVAGPLPILPATRIWFISAIIRYIPGNVWQPLSMTYYCQRWGIRPEATITSVALYMMFILLAAAPIAAVYFFVTGNFGLLNDLLAGSAPLFLIAGIMPVIAFLLRPQWFMVIVNWGLRLIGRPTLETTLTTPRLLGLLLAAIVNWLLWGVSFAALTFAISSHNLADIRTLAPHLIASFPIAYVIGFLSLITPSGFGVREGAFYLLLVPLMDGGLVAVAALASRIWTIVGELTMAGLSILFLPAAPSDVNALSPELEGEPPAPLLEV